ncbi:MAG: hypothetical protein ACYCT3_02010 [Acidiferrobacter sp.]
MEVFRDGIEEDSDPPARAGLDVDGHRHARAHGALVPFDPERGL